MKKLADAKSANFLGDNKTIEKRIVREITSLPD
ncbi:MAG: hypothetical protein ACI82Z_000693 [Cellvibrionaceae bacterium]|jgi:hypothetical protein